MKNLIKGLAGAAALAFAAGSVQAQEAKEPIKFGLFLDFTAVYTFVSDEYNQGQRDYLTLINEEGGVDGHKVEAIVRDTGNQPQRGIEAYNRAKREGAVLFDFLSTPVSRAIVKRALQDEVVLLTPFHGRGDASDGETFPYVFPAFATYWSQAAILAKYIEDHADGLKGKKIAHVYIDSPFGREPLPILEDLAAEKDFELRSFPYPSPGNEQSAVWTDVRRFRPDFVFIWGAGGGQAVSAREAIRNGISPEKLLSVVWFAETDARSVGANRVKGLKRFEGVAPGTDHSVIQRIQDKVIDAGKGAGEAENVGSSYYNVGVATMALSVEGARLALEEFGAPLTGDKLRKGLEMVENFDADGLMAPITLTPEDHQGGGFGRVSQWDGEKWVPQTDWYNAYQDLVWHEIEQGAEDFREGQ
ncbi:hypothetical protein KBTX_03213 [wastewater metagenome]|uniref:Leucine-binding protein domain-containing protein n=2 Tax=unclassified sequences TaxID=12908 RepID=A0A5B8RH62_9ZZZZ|nr:ABC transporter substrate-binding protein [Arhodomonas sp. KWT]QEA06872.1 hypothetical protein KBTEX_03213 [uncultured organism]